MAEPAKKTTAVIGTIGKGIKTVVDGNKLFIEVDLSKDFGPSKTGKSIILASSEGNQNIDGVDGRVRLGFNLYRKA